MPASPLATPVVAFDLDGVLVEVSASYREAIRHTVAALSGGVVGPAEVQALKNAGGFNNDWDLSQELLRRRGLAVERGRVIEVFNRFYLGAAGDGEGGLIQQERWLLPAELLAALRQRFRLAIFTGRPGGDAELVLRRFGVREAFDNVVVMEDVAEQKPSPEGLLELQRRHAPAPLTAYIGDSIDDARCAAAAEVPFVAVLEPGQAGRAELEAQFWQSGCQKIVADVSAAARLLLEPAAGRA